MTQTTLQRENTDRLHVAIIMDGNGRWATSRGLPRSSGHQEGAKAVRRVIETAPDFGIGTLTLYAFSSDNWRRPAQEVALLMQLFDRYLKVETKRCVKEGVRLSVIGRRDRLPRGLRRRMEASEKATARGTVLHLRLAVDYSSRDAILEASRLARGANLSREEFAKLVSSAYSGEASAPDVDLLIRTGGERRLSDFLLWESAYAEIHFTPCMWPEFGTADLEEAVREFHARERRFGAVPENGSPPRKLAGS